MKSYLASCVVVALLAAFASANSCTITMNVTKPWGIEEEEVDLSRAGTFAKNVTVSKTNVFIGLSPCAPTTFGDGNSSCTGYASIITPDGSNCFQAPGNETYNPATNTTEITFKKDLLREMMRMMKLVFAGSVNHLKTSYVCRPAGKDELTFEGGSIKGSTLYATFGTDVACPEYLTTAAPVAPTLPAPGPKDSGLSTWAIVGIIVGAVVAVVVIGAVVMKCKSSPPQAEGEYSRV